MDLWWIWDPKTVWKFQSFFGVRKVAIVRSGDSDAPWIAIDARRMPRPVLVEEEEGEQEEEEEGRRKRNGGGKFANLTEEKTEVKAHTHSQRSSSNIIYYSITNPFFHLLFLFGSQLGNEALLGLFFSIWFWILDGYVGRRLVLMWTFVMYIGQGLKDIIRIARPAMPPVVKLEGKWALEYGLPSTHAMTALAVPGTALLSTLHRYEYPLLPWGSLAVCWCVLVCCSRVYLGMHSLADILAGLLLSSLLLLLLLPLVEYSDQFLLTSPLAPPLTLCLSSLAIWLYPGSDRWTPARGDTAATLGTYFGVQLGEWLNYQSGILGSRPGSFPQPVVWPHAAQYGVLLLRVVIGALVGIMTRAVAKPLSFQTVCAVLQVEPETLRKQEPDVRNKPKLAAEMFCKFCTYMACGFNVTFLTPVVFSALGCGRLGPDSGSVLGMAEM